MNQGEMASSAAAKPPIQATDGPENNMNLSQRSTIGPNTLSTQKQQQLEASSFLPPIAATFTTETTYTDLNMARVNTEKLARDGDMPTDEESFVQNAAAAEDTLDYESDDDVQMQLTLLQQAYDETRQEYKKGHKLFSASLKALARVVHPLERFIKNNETRLLSIFTRMDAVLSSCNNGEYRLEDLQTVQEAMKNDIDEMDNHLCFMIMFKASITEYTLASCFVDNRSTQAYDSSASDVTNTTLKVPTMKEQDPSTPASELEKIKLDTHAELVAVHSTLDSLDKRHKELQHLIYERWNSTKHTLKDFSTDLIIASMSPLCCQPALLEDSMRNGLPPGQIDLAIGTLSQGIADMQEEAIAAEELSKKLTAFELEKELVNATRHFE